jgi:hypothetical protein
MKHKMRLNPPTLDDFLYWYEPSYRCAVLQHESTPDTSRQRVNFHEESKPKANHCSFCRLENHNIEKCKRFIGQNLKRRWEFVRKGRWCFNCLKGKHFTNDCWSKELCGVDQCKEKHHRLLHKPITAERTTPEVRSTQTNVHQQAHQRTYFRVVPVKLVNGHNQITTWAFLDEGSGPTLLSQEIANKLQLNAKAADLCLKWSDGTTKKMKSGIVDVKVSGINEEHQFVLRNVQTVPMLDLPAPNLNIDDLKARYAHLKDVVVPDVPVGKPELLIGLEHVKLMIPYQIREGSWNEPIATKTRIGWAIYGSDNRNTSCTENYSCHICECVEGEKIDELIRNFQATEAFGVAVPQKELVSASDERSLQIFEKTLKLSNGRYEIGLLWKNNNIKLPDNRGVALRRLTCFEHNLLKDPVLQKAVKEKICDNISKGYLQKVSEVELERYNGPKWFLPMFSVQNPNKPAKIRLVYDAAAKCDGVSLNDVLLKGPDNLTSLLGVLLRFREGKIGVCGDIAEMFHRVKITPADQYARLVLWRDVNLNVPPTTYKLTVMSFGATCSPSAAQHVKNINGIKFQQQYPRAVDGILNRHYVDDYLDCANTIEEATQLVHDVTKIHAHGGFEIRNWISNSKQLIEKITKKNISEENTTVSLDMGEEKSAEKVLGMYWDTENDNFIFKTNFVKIDPQILQHKRKPTKGEVLKVVMSLFDPFGMMATIVMPAKVLIQNLWRYGCDWDKQIPDELYSAWKNWLLSLEAVQNVKVSRWFSPLLMSAKNIQLHVLADASELAFAAVAYLRVANEESVEVSFVTSKTRIAPQKPLSVPRLELQAALLASRLATTLRHELSAPINNTTLWSDSQTVLGWLRSTHRRYSSFVSHRVGEILDNTKLDDWRWVPSKANVADDGTKWEEIPQIPDRWFSGPLFLSLRETEWPIEKNKAMSTTEEERAIQYHAPLQRVSTVFSVIRIERFSKWKRLLRTTAFVLRYLRNLKKSTTKRIFANQLSFSNKHKLKSIEELNGDELNEAQTLLMKRLQHDCYVQEIAHEFWTRWLQQYLPTIATRSKWFDDTKPLEVGKLVLLMDDSIKRGEWKRGIIKAIYKSHDGKIRSATVKTAKGTFLRPVSKLAVVNCESNEQNL